jgi:hypothetical protein
LKSSGGTFQLASSSPNRIKISEFLVALELALIEAQQSRMG